MTTTLRPPIWESAFVKLALHRAQLACIANVKSVRRIEGEFEVHESELTAKTPRAPTS